MLQRQLTASLHLYQNIQYLVPPVSRLLSAQHHKQRHSTHYSRNMAAAAAADAMNAVPSSDTAAEASSSASGIVIYDKEALKRTIRGVVFDMDGTLTVPVIDFQYMRQVSSRRMLGVMDMLCMQMADG